MPKQVYKILDFTGGQNTSADPRDLVDNEFQQLDGWSVEHHGKLVELGNMLSRKWNNDQHDFGSVSAPLEVGYGTFAIVTDKTGFTKDPLMSFTITGCTYNNDPTITHNANSDLECGDPVSGDSIPSGAYVGVVTDSTHFELYKDGSPVSTTGGLHSGETLTIIGSPASVKKAYGLFHNGQFTTGAALNMFALDDKPVRTNTDGTISDLYDWFDKSNMWESQDNFELDYINCPIFYYTKQGLRVLQADHAYYTSLSDANKAKCKPKIRYYHDVKLYGGLDGSEGTGDNRSYVYNNPADGTNSGSGWRDTVVDGRIKGAFPSINTEPQGSHAGTIAVGQNLIMANCTDGTYHNEARGFAFAGETVDTGNDANDLTSGSANNCYWGLGMKHAEYSNGTGNWMPDKDTRYRFYCSTVYDGEQESIPQLFSMYKSRSLFDGKGKHIGQKVVYDMPFSNGNAWFTTGGATYSSSSTTITHDGTFRGELGMYVLEESGDFPADTKISAINSATEFVIDKNTTGSSSVGTTIHFGARDDKINGERIALSLSPVVKWSGADHGDTWAGDGLAGGEGYNFGAPADNDKTGGNPRITGVRIYYSSNEEGHVDLWQLFDWDFERGIKARGAEGGSNTADASGWVQGDSTRMTNSGEYWYHHFHGGANVGSLAGDIGEGFKFLDPPKVITYKDINGHGHDEIVHVDSARACTLVNNRVYLGNVQQDGVIYGDRMIKSPMGQHDKFPESHFIDVLTDDGDEIIALENYADRILQFKKNAMHVINVADDNEMLEMTHRFKGVPHPGCVCKTEFGIAWINQHGLFMYDGQRVLNLLEKEGKKRVSEDQWRAYVGHEDGVPQIGYLAKKRMLVIKNGSSTTGAGGGLRGSDSGWVYDLVTQAIVQHNNFLHEKDGLMPFFNDPVTGDLLAIDEESNVGSSVQIWQETQQINIDDHSSTEGYLQSQDQDGTAHTYEGENGPWRKLWTRDIDFGDPHVRKKLYKIYVSYKGNMDDATAKFYVNGESDKDDGYQFNGTDTPFEDKSSAENMETWHTIELKPTNSSEANNIYSCSLRIYHRAVNSMAQINDISFVYRIKNVK